MRKLVAQVRPYCSCPEFHLSTCIVPHVGRWYTVARYFESGDVVWRCSCGERATINDKYCSHICALFDKRVVEVANASEADDITRAAKGVVGGYTQRDRPATLWEHVPAVLTPFGRSLLYPAWAAHALQDTPDRFPPGLVE